MPDDTLLNQGGDSTPPANGQQQTPPANNSAGLDYSTLIGADGTIKDPAKFFDGETAHLAKRFTSVPALAKSYAGLEKLLSGNKVVVPKEDSPDEVREAFYKAIGRPDKPEEYGLARPETVDERLWDEAGAKEFATLAHQLGLSKTQASKLAEWELGRGSKALTMREQAEAAEREKAVGTLKTEWPGELFSTNVKLARQAAISFAGPEVVNSPLANDPTFIRIMSKVGAMMGEGSAAGARQGGNSLGMNPQAEIEKVFADKNDPYFIKTHPQHQTRVDYVSRLFAMKHA